MFRHDCGELIVDIADDLELETTAVRAIIDVQPYRMRRLSNSSKEAEG